MGTCVCVCVNLKSHEWQPVIHLVWELSSPCYLAKEKCPPPAAWNLVSMNFLVLVITQSAPRIKGYIPHVEQFMGILAFLRVIEIQNGDM